jgi:general secretion pathway protein H
MGRDIKPTRGFTLMEIMVVMVIAGLMIALVPPLFSGAVSGTKLKGSVRDLAVILRETRSQAINTNTEQIVQLDLESSRYRAGDAKPRALPEDAAIAIELVSGARVAEMAQHVVRFFPDGSSSGELITISEGARAYHLHLNWLTGSITITEGLRDAG